MDVIKSAKMERSVKMNRKRLSLISAVMVLTLSFGTFAGVVNAQGGGTAVAGGFNGPMGVLVAPDGSVWVIDSGVGGDTEIEFFNPDTGEQETATIGDTARVVKIASDGTQTVAANLPSVLVGTEALGGARLALVDGALYATNGGWIETSGPSPAAPTIAAVVKIEDGEAVPIASLWALENSRNPDGFIKESHPYGLLAGPDGNLWVADAGGNTLIRVVLNSDGVDVVAAFDGVPSPLPNPNRDGAMESDPVPTGITLGDDGNIYVAFLPGFPFLPGSAKIVQVTPDGQVSDYATGLTMVTDLRKGPDGALYAVQLGEFTEQGPVPNSGSIVRVKEGAEPEAVLSNLSFPTSIDFSANGDAYVTINGVGAPGSGEVVMFTGLSQTDPAPAPAELPTTGGVHSDDPLAGSAIIALGLALLALGLLWRPGTSSRAGEEG
jgi:sugar lactone lactonase YvrE